MNENWEVFVIFFYLDFERNDEAEWNWSYKKWVNGEETSEAFGFYGAGECNFAGASSGSVRIEVASVG